MNIMRRKLGKNGGFTLVEMLIVVAIIAILIAVSIPLVTESLEKARDATDIANERSAKAEAAMVYMDAVNDPDTDNNGVGELKEALIESPTGTGYGTGEGLVYNAKTGKLGTADVPTADRYGKCTGATQCASSAWLSTGGGTSHVGGQIRIFYNETTAQYRITWET